MQRCLLPVNVPSGSEREIDLGILQSYKENRMYQPPTKYRSEPTAHLSSERRQLRGAPVHWSAVILDSESHMLQTQKERYQYLLDGDSQKTLNAESHHYGGAQPFG